MAYKHVIRAKTKNLLNITPSMCHQCIYEDDILKANVVNFYYAFLKVTDLFEIGNTYTVSWSIIHKKSYQTAGVVVYGKSKTDPDKTVFHEYRTNITGNNYTFTINDEDFSSILYVELRFFRYGTITTDTESSILNIQVELGSTPTPYTPYNYLQSNKRMIKVSNVCQLYAKNIWKEYTDLYGVSIKNNNDGSITLNGTATETFYYTNLLDYEIKPNHVYFYFDAYNEEPSWSTYVGGCEGKIIDASGASGANYAIYNYAIYNLKKEGTIAKAYPDLPKNLLNTFCMVYKGFTLNNVTIKPQLFDLTEMFGAGHEPATVAEFRQRFPNELYPYSPQCWLTSYKSAVVCKTKNLFDVNKITESTNLKNNKDGTITVSVYGVSGGLLKNLCPELKVGDVIKVYFQPLRWTAPKPPLVMVVGDVVVDRNGNSKLTVTEKSLNKPVWFYNNHYDERGLPGTTIIGNILITTDLTITNKNHNERYTPYQHL